MFPASLGRRLVIIVQSLTIMVVGLVVFIAIDTSTRALRAVTEETFTDRHRSLTNIVLAQVESLEARGEALAAETGSRSRWTSGELRAYVIEIVGSSGTNLEIVNVNVLRSEEQAQIFTYDYTEPDDLPPGIILPINRGSNLEDLQEAWVLDGLERTRPYWHGPDMPLLGSYDQPVMSYIIPLSDPAGVLWIDVPLYVFNTALNNIIAAETDSISQTRDGYTFLINGEPAQVVITSIDTPEGRAVPGEPLRELIPLPNIGQPIQMDDPLIENQDAFALNDVIPGTGWRLVAVIPNQVLQRALPLSSVTRLAIVTILGLIGVAIIVQQFIRNTVTEPLNRLGLAAQEIGSGDLRYQIDYRHREDEIGRLARALDDMKSNLAGSYNELQRWSSTLEDRVRQRTRELDIARHEAQTNATELRAVYDESLLVVSAYQLQTILQTLTQRIYSLLEASYTGVWLVTEAGDELRLVSSSNPDKSRLNVTIGVDQGLVGQAVSSKELMVVDDYPNWSGKLDVNTHEYMHQAMAVPLIFSGEAIGAVIVGRTYDAPFFEVDDQRLLQLFANLVSPAVRNAQLFVQRDLAVEEAQRANQVKTRFLASVTHELRTPLNLVINNMDFMRIGAFGDVNEEQQERLNQTIRSAEHLLYLINDLLDVSKIEAGEMQLFIQEASLYPIIEDAIANTETILEQYNRAELVELMTEIEPEIPPIPMDARRIRQVFVNLLSNAVKFTEQGSVTLRVSNRRHYIRIDVTDTGMGIPEDEIDKLFEAFERTNTAKEKAIEGTGLGLPICKFLVEAHGGEMTVQSVLGEGTTFTFIIPTKQRRQKSSDTPQSMNTVLQRTRKN